MLRKKPENESSGSPSKSSSTSPFCVIQTSRKWPKSCPQTSFEIKPNNLFQIILFWYNRQSISKFYFGYGQIYNDLPMKILIKHRCIKTNLPVSSSHENGCLSSILPVIGHESLVIHIHFRGVGKWNNLFSGRWLQELIIQNILDVIRRIVSSAHL